jgi:hypothetical protein
MKKNIIFLIISTCCFELTAGVKCYIKVGFGDCINCYNTLSIVDGLNKIYVFKNDYKGIEKEILKKHFGIEGDIDIRTSDSFYNSFGYENLTVLSFFKEDVQLMKFPLVDINLYKSSIEKLKFDLKPVDGDADLQVFWHGQCQVQLNSSNDIIILDPLLNKLSKLDENGNLINEFNLNEKFTKEVYIAKFGKRNSILSDFLKTRHFLGIKSVPISFNSLSLYKNEIYVLITGRYFILDNLDTVLSSFYSVVKFNENFDINILNVESEIKPDYFLGQSYFHVVNDSSVLIDVISVNPLNEKFIIAENKITNNEIQFARFYDDTIPYKLVDKRLFYRVTTFKQDDGIVAYFMFNRIFKNSKALPNLKLFDSYKFGKEIPNPHNFITDIKNT